MLIDALLIQQLIQITQKVLNKTAQWQLPLPISDLSGTLPV